MRVLSPLALVSPKFSGEFVSANVRQQVVNILPSTVFPSLIHTFWSRGRGSFIHPLYLQRSIFRPLTSLPPKGFLCPTWGVWFLSKKALSLVSSYFLSCSSSPPVVLDRLPSSKFGEGISPPKKVTPARPHIPDGVPPRLHAPRISSVGEIFHRKTYRT